ncbi:MAG: hypothetical protein KC421_26125 [Anaerolineales bacterium]|nr:hypothetical protein [Anaerolineales bacterium]
MFSLQINQPEPPTLDSLLKRYKNNRRLRKVTPVYESMLVEAKRQIKIAFIYGQFPHSTVETLHPWLSTDTTDVILAICTLGPELDNSINRLSKEDLLTAVILKEIALAWIVNLTREIHRAARRQIAQNGLKVGPAYRPGVGRWPIEAQQTIFAHLPAADIGVTLDDYLMMRPTISTSLIIPIIDRSQTK